MKKIILSLVVLFTVSSAFAKVEENPNSTPKLSTIAVSNVSAFCKLIQMGDYEAVKALVKSGENVNKKSNGLTPLMFAARHNKAKIAQLLIDNGARLNARATKSGLTALDLAKKSKAMDSYKVIKSAIEK